MYSMDDLSTRLNISKQAIYRLINNNKELSSLLNEHSRRVRRKVFYDDAVLEWLCNHYGAEFENSVANGEARGIFENENEEVPNDSAPSASARIEALETQVRELEEKLKATEEERQRLHQENGALLLTVSQLSNTITQMSNTAFQQFQASVKMLPAPRKSIFQRIKSAFVGEGKQDLNDATEPHESE